jgi:hypothetical protein
MPLPSACYGWIIDFTVYEYHFRLFTVHVSHETPRGTTTRHIGPRGEMGRSYTAVSYPTLRTAERVNAHMLDQMVGILEVYNRHAPPSGNILI